MKMSSNTMDDEDSGLGTKSPIKRLGSTRKLLFFNNIRLQLSEQLRCLDVRMEAQVALVAELQDYFRRRAELELDYSKNLDKLAKSLQLRHKEQKQKREYWPLFSSYSCWQQLVTQTKNLSKDHAALSEIHSTHLVSRLGQVMEDVQRIYRKCREIGNETHEDILRVLHELHTTMKTYHAYQAEFRQAENKLRVAENQRLKQESTLPREKLDRSKKYRLIEKEVQKRKNKYNDAKLKALKARNEYMLCLEASNTTIHKYFVDDLSDLIDCMDFGFHNCISRALLMHISAEEGLERSVQAGLDNLHNCIKSLDSRLDKQRFLEFNHTAFMIPKKFEFQGLRGDDGPEPELQKGFREELEARLMQLQQRITSLRTESEEVWKTLETAETTLLEMLNAKDYDCSEYFGENAVPASKPPETVSIKLRADRQETEEFYLSFYCISGLVGALYEGVNLRVVGILLSSILQKPFLANLPTGWAVKFREYVLGTSRIARLDAKHEHIRHTLLEAGGDSPNWLSSVQNHKGNNQGSLPQTKPPRRKRIGRQMNGQPKLFGGSLEEYLEATNQEIPLIVKSCIRVINLYGLHHQGIFRVSGSQVEINNFREAFERGEDPLADVTDASDINSVAGVLKLYLRELREPLFPIIYFEQFMELAQEESKHGFVAKMRDLIQSLPKAVVIVMKYLFAFLNHLSEFSDENMMDPYNLAICFGPTLVPVPEEKDQVQYQNLVNELIKNIILFNEEIFPTDIGTVLYEKYISKEPDECDVGDSPSDQIQEDLDSEVYPSEDESDVLEATAQFDFIARSDRELSLKKGDHVTLYSQVSNDWWRGSVNGQEGLIPDKYILLKIKDEDREKVDILKSSSSEESMRRRASSSNDSVLSSGTSSSTHNSPLISVSPMAWPGENEQRNDWAERNKNGEPVALLTTAHEESVIETPNHHPSKEKEDFEASPSRSGSCSLEGSITSTQTLSPIPLRSEDNENNRINGTDADPKSKDSSPRRKTHWKSQSVSESVKDSLTNFTQNRELWQRRAASQGQIDPPVTSRHSQDLWELRQKHTPDLVMDLPFVGGSKDGLDKSIAEEDSGSESSSPGPESPDMTTAERFAKQNQCTLKKNTKVNPPRTKSSSEVINEKSSSEVATLGNFLNSEKIIQVKSELELVINPVTHQQRLTPKMPVKFAPANSPPVVPSNKPQIKQKPQILKKPVLPLPVPPTQTSPEMSQKDTPN